MTEHKQVWLVIGKVTDPDAHTNAKEGDTEYQFSDGPAGERSSSADYVDLTKGLNNHIDYDLIISAEDMRHILNIHDSVKKENPNA